MDERIVEARQILQSAIRDYEHQRDHGFSDTMLFGAKDQMMAAYEHLLDMEYATGYLLSGEEV
jgi:hypothetical protein